MFNKRNKFQFWKKERSIKDILFQKEESNFRLIFHKKKSHKKPLLFIFLLIFILSLCFTDQGKSLVQDIQDKFHGASTAGADAAPEEKAITRVMSGDKLPAEIASFLDDIIETEVLSLIKPTKNHNFVIQEFGNIELYYLMLNYSDPEVLSEDQLIHIKKEEQEGGFELSYTIFGRFNDGKNWGLGEFNDGKNPEINAATQRITWHNEEGGMSTVTNLVYAVSDNTFITEFLKGISQSQGDTEARNELLENTSEEIQDTAQAYNQVIETLKTELTLAGHAPIVKGFTTGKELKMVVDSWSDKTDVRNVVITKATLGEITDKFDFVFSTDSTVCLTELEKAEEDIYKFQVSLDYDLDAETDCRLNVDLYKKPSEISFINYFINKVKAASGVPDLSFGIFVDIEDEAVFEDEAPLKLLDRYDGVTAVYYTLEGEAKLNNVKNNLVGHIDAAEGDNIDIKIEETFSPSVYVSAETVWDSTDSLHIVIPKYLKADKEYTITYQNHTQDIIQFIKFKTEVGHEYPLQPNFDEFFDPTLEFGNTTGAFFNVPGELDGFRVSLSLSNVGIQEALFHINGPKLPDGQVDVSSANDYYQVSCAQTKTEHQGKSISEVLSALAAVSNPFEVLDIAKTVTVQTIEDEVLISGIKFSEPHFCFAEIIHNKTDEVSTSSTHTTHFQSFIVPKYDPDMVKTSILQAADNIILNAEDLVNHNDSLHDYITNKILNLQPIPLTSFEPFNFVIYDTATDEVIMNNNGLNEKLHFTPQMRTIQVGVQLLYGDDTVFDINKAFMLVLNGDESLNHTLNGGAAGLGSDINIDVDPNIQSNTNVRPNIVVKPNIKVGRENNFQSFNSNANLVKLQKQNEYLNNKVDKLSDRLQEMKDLLEAVRDARKNRPQNHIFTELVLKSEMEKMFLELVEGSVN